MMTRSLLLLAGLSALAGCAGRPSSSVFTDEPFEEGVTADRLDRRDWFESGWIRVGLLVDQARIGLEAEGGFDAFDASGQRVLADVVPGDLAASVVDAGLRLERNGDVVLQTSEAWLRLRPTDPRSLWKAKNNEYEGEMILRRAGPRSLTLVNALSVEAYLRGVVPWEIGRPDPDALEAVKAQAIAARTYAYRHLGHWDGQGFDLYDSVADQVYRGVSGTDPVTDRAVRDTAGRVVAYHGELIRAYYSSTCGGHTCTIGDVWTREPAPYLVGVRDAAPGRPSWCRDSPHFRWVETWSARELGETIRTYLPAELDASLTPQAIGTLEGLEVVQRDLSGRVQRLRIVTDRGRFEVWGDRIRWVLRPVHGRSPVLRSTLFDVEEVRRDGKLVAVIVRGGGNGHGVGLCQTGALAMAAGGADAETILRHYYASVSIVDVGAVHPDFPEVAR